MNDFTEEFKSISADHIAENNEIAIVESAPIAIQIIANEALVEEVVAPQVPAEPAGPNPFELLGLAPLAGQSYRRFGLQRSYRRASARDPTGHDRALRRRRENRQ